MTRNHWCHLDLHVPQVIRSKEGHGNRGVREGFLVEGRAWC